MNRIRKSYRWFIQPLLVVSILLFGFIGAMSFNLFDEQTENTQQTSYAPLVRVTKLQPQSHVVTIQSNGSIQAHTRIELVAQVGGRVNYIHPSFRAGGSFRANEVLLRIEPLDYQLAVTQNQAEVAAARTALELETAEAEAAREEWLNLNPDQGIPALVGRKPQIEEATAQLNAAEARLAKARLDLKRTELTLPFNGRVVTSTIDMGGVVNANQSVGTVYSTHSFEIPVPLELNQLAWIRLGENENSSHASILISIGQHRFTLPAKISRIDSELEERSRFAHIILTLESKNIPAELQQTIVPGLFVDVEIEAQKLTDVTVVPRSAFHSGDTLWLIDNDQLRIVRPDILYRSREEFIVSGLEAESVIVISELDVVTDGMQVRVSDETE